MFPGNFMILFTNKTLFYLFIFFQVILLSVNLSSQSIIFNHINTSDGLSNNYVSDIYQDRTGFLWFATDDGLNRFDGYEFKVYRNNPNNSHSISDNTVISFSDDREGNLWIGTKNGFVNKYDAATDQFVKWEIKSDITKENPINVLYVDKRGYVWIGTYRSGLYRLNPVDGKIDHWLFSPDNPASLTNNLISAIVEDELGNFWIGTFNGLNRFRPYDGNQGFERFYADKSNPNSITDDLIWGITRSKNDKNKFYLGTSNGITILNPSDGRFEKIEIPNPGKLQFGTGSGFVLEETFNGEQILWTNSYAGLIRINRSKNQFLRYLPDKNDDNSIVSYQINKILKDNSGVLWIATNQGLSFFTQKNNKFNNPFQAEPFNFESPLQKTFNTTTLLKTISGKLLIGTDNGLYYSAGSKDQSGFLKYPVLSRENIWSLAEDNSGNIWIGTYGHGLYLLKQKDKRTEKQDVLKNLVASQSRNFIKSLLVDNKNNLWVGTWGVGLAKVDLSTKKVIHYHHLNNNVRSISHDDIWVIFRDSKNRIWIGTNGGGLNLYRDLDGGVFYRPGQDFNTGKSLGSNSIYSICESTVNKDNIDQSILWIGTNSGLDKMVIDNSITTKTGLPEIILVKHFSSVDGLADNSVKTIIEDSEGNLWLGTSAGISFVDVKQDKFINYNSADGVTGNDFNFSSGTRFNDNLILIGSTSGLNYFNPRLISQSNYSPAVVITDFLIFNKSIKPLSPPVLTKSIFKADQVTLSYSQNVFSFQFASLDYNNSSSIFYAYMMQGFDKDWIKSSTRRFVTYTNLNPGEYTFKVKATNSDGLWSKNVASIKVIITPPWWQTTWAIIFYFFVFISGSWAIFKFQENRGRLQQELKMREFEAYHLKEVEKMKSRFFENISHEFRTPLMLIKGPIEELARGRIKDNIADYYKMLLRNTEKLQHLIDQLLDLTKIESETIPLKKECHDIITLTEAFTNSFIPLAEQKNIKLEFTSSTDSAFALLDKSNFEKIINNLLNNAFKFTGTGGIVSVEIFVENTDSSRTARISICDSGIGISTEDQSKIFNRFFQADDKSNRNSGGSGIGLAIVKELINLHGWNIIVKSKEKEGAEFIISVPLLSEDDVKNHSLNQGIAPEKESLDERNSRTIKFQYTGTKPLLLLVEDSNDVRIYIESLLKEDYSVLLAENGKTGLEIAHENQPELIVSDIMMPVMDGLEFCKKIKTDLKTCHIPVILLTAKASHQSKLEGLEFGADDYLTKPFDFEELSVRIKNLITQRRLLKDKFNKDVGVSIVSMATNTFDKEFLEKINRIIEDHLPDENFTSENLAEELFVSRSQLNRKLNAITGQGPGEFIRIFKLKHAARLITEKKLSITQVALEVGFSSPAQFTRAFQKHFNCLPSEYLTNNKS